MHIGKQGEPDKVVRGVKGVWDAIKKVRAEDKTPASRVGEKPSFDFTHFWAKGPSEKLAKGLRSAFDSQAEAAKKSMGHR